MEQENKKRTWWRWLILTVSILLVVAGVAYLVFYFVQKEQNQDIYTELQGYNKTLTLELQEPEEEVKIPIDFAKLKKKNADIYAWIRIEDTRIDYPIVQSATDDSYYLNHTVDGQAGYPGSIYTESVNAKDFTDFNTLIYGHDMMDGSMFKHLHKFESEKFFKEHDTITIYTETEIKTYRIYAAVVFDDRHIVYSFDQETPEGRLEFIKALKTSMNWKTHFREGMEIDENSRLITLSTCIANQPTKRYIVVAEEVIEP